MRALPIAAFVLMAVAAFAPAGACAQGPVPPKAVKGEKCVAPQAVMRRNHPDFLRHQRDETTRQGIRGNKYSLRDCVECHAVPVKDAPGQRDVQAFCAACHAYAAVSIDCFQCHTGRAEKSTKTGLFDAAPGGAELLKSMTAHLGSGNGQP